MPQFLLQMAGWMGTGKSTIAARVGAETGAVVVDHDTTKSAILAAGVPHPPAGAASYEVVFALTEDLAAQGHSVIIDSPSVYASIPERGMALADAAGVPYFFVECWCADAVAHARLDGRERRRSQVTPAIAAAVRRDPARIPHRPSLGVLDLDTSGGLQGCIATVLAHLDGPGASGPVVPERSTSQRN